MPDLLDTLKTLPDDQIRPFYATNTGRRRLVVDVPDNLRHKRRVAARRFLDASKVANAAEHIGELPGKAESLHLVLKGNADFWDFVPAVRQLAGNIDLLVVGTMGFNRRGADSLVRMLDAGEIGRCLFLCAVYWKVHDHDLFDFVATELERRGSKAAAGRNHAKIVMFEMRDGRHFVIEGSGNLRSCRNTEQLVISQDVGLFDFHHSWIARMIDRADTQDAEQGT